MLCNRHSLRLISIWFFITSHVAVADPILVVRSPMLVFSPSINCSNPINVVLLKKDDTVVIQSSNNDICPMLLVPSSAITARQTGQVTLGGSAVDRNVQLKLVG